MIAKLLGGHVLQSAADLCCIKYRTNKKWNPVEKESCSLAPRVAGGCPRLLSVEVPDDRQLSDSPTSHLSICVNSYMKSITSSFSFPSMITASCFLTKTENNLSIPKSSLSLLWLWGWSSSWSLSAASSSSSSSKMQPASSASPQECIPLSPLEASGQDLNLGKGIPTCANFCTIVYVLVEFILFRNKDRNKRERKRDRETSVETAFVHSFLNAANWNHQELHHQHYQTIQQNINKQHGFTCFRCCLFLRSPFCWEHYLIFFR